MNKTTIAPPLTGFITSFMRKPKAAVAAATPVLRAAARVSHGPFQLQAKVSSGCAYEIQASSDLRHWSSLVSADAFEDVIDFADTDASKFSFRFYRARSGQLVSTSILGYASVLLPPGFSMIANPLNAPSNTVEDLFPNMADGTTICKFDANLFRLTNNVVKDGSWTRPNEELLPGEGAIFFNPTIEFKTLNFVGEVTQGHLRNAIPAGLSIRSSLAPQAGRLGSDLGFPAMQGDVVHLFDRNQQKYVVYPFSQSEWDRNPPSVGVGESFWVSRTNPGNWEQDFPAS